MSKLFGTHFCYWYRAKGFARQRNAAVSASQGVTNPATDRSRALTFCVDLFAFKPARHVVPTAG